MGNHYIMWLASRSKVFNLPDRKSSQLSKSYRRKKVYHNTTHNLAIKFITHYHHITFHILTYHIHRALSVDWSYITYISTTIELCSQTGLIITHIPFLNNTGHLRIPSQLPLAPLIWAPSHPHRTTLTCISHNILWAPLHPPQVLRLCYVSHTHIIHA